jgi:flagellar motor switch protein FliG
MPLFAEDFSDLLFLDRDELVTLLIQVTNETLLIALMDCEAEVLSRVRSVLSVAGREYLDDDLVHSRIRCIDASPLAQQSILDTLNGLVRGREIGWAGRKLVC